MTEIKKQYLPTLKKASLFAGLNDDDLYELAQTMYYCEFEKKQTLVYEGEMGNELHIVVDGEVDVSVAEKPEAEVGASTGKKTCASGDETCEQISVGKIEAGDFFGEMAMLEQVPRSASCTAMTPVKTLVLKSKDFLGLIETKPKMAGKILRNMLETTSARLLTTSSFVSQLVQWGETAKRRAVTDKLTGLFNRRYLDAYMESLLIDAISEKCEVSFAMLDVDHFGNLNQKYGQEFCDELLVELAGIFTTSFGKDDILVRYGGDEFCFLIRGDFSKAVLQCRLVCARLNALRFAEFPELIASCSIGLAFYKSGMTAGTLSKIADAQLYKAKKAGRNCVKW